MKPIFLTLTLAAAPALAAPVGMAAHVSGTVTLNHEGKALPLRLLQRLEPGDTVQAGAASGAVLVLFGDGSRFQVGPGGRATVTGNGITGAQKMAAFAGPSAGVVKLLGGSRVGAAISRQANSLQRLLPNSPGWIEAGQTHLDWLPIAGAAYYTFTLFDQHDNVVWSGKAGAPSVSDPALAGLQPKRPYLWRLAGFTTGGKPLPEARSGLITFLAPEDIKTLSASAADLNAPAPAGNDTTPLLLLAELYRSYGVVGKTLEVLEDERLRNEPGAGEAHAQVIAEQSAFVQAICAP